MFWVIQPGEPGDRRIHVVSLVASIGLTLALLSTLVFVTAASLAAAAASARTRAAIQLNTLYADARVSVTREESLERKYRLEPSLGVARAHEAAARDLTRQLHEIVSSTTPARTAETLGLLKLHEQYVRATRRMFAAVDARDPATAERIDRETVDPIFSIIEARVWARAAEQGRIATTTFDAFSTRRRSLFLAGTSLSVLSLSCVAAFLFVIGAYRRRLIASHQSEVRRIEASALVDSLTHIGNHRAFTEDIGRELARAVRHETQLTLAVLDIDNFKLVNDNSGHAQGDRVLLELANVLSAGRAEDRAYRLGGDEFALILPHTSADAARSILERIRIDVSKALYGSTVSIGFSTASDSATTAEALHNQADAALYLTKRSGRNGVSQFDPSHKGTWLLSTERVVALQTLLASATMPIAFQPIWDLHSGDILAFEALLRPDFFGFAGPRDAFSLAERIGRAKELDRACMLSALRRIGELPADALLFLNISAQTLGRDFDIAAFTASISSFGVHPMRIVVEITDSSIEHTGYVVAAASSMQRAGFGIALDNTGTGNAGLEIMGRLHFDYVKIDQEIIVKAINQRAARGVVAAIVAFAHETGAFVIAQGIEDLAMLDFIDQSVPTWSGNGRGIRGAQGNLLSRPSHALPERNDILVARMLLRERVAVERTA